MLDRLKPSTSRKDVLGYVYRPLNNLLDEIRVLHFLPPDPKNPDIIRCSLRHRSLRLKPTYIALSYVWGDPNVTVPILINGCELRITTNLAEALRQLHAYAQADGTKSVWINALCINQQNDKEKSHQVQRMGTMFRGATTVFAWLGPANNTSAIAMQRVKTSSKIAQSLQIRSVTRPESQTMTQYQRDGLALDVARAAANSSLQKGGFALINDLLHKTYWSRM